MGYAAECSFLHEPGNDFSLSTPLPPPISVICLPKYRVQLIQGKINIVSACSGVWLGERFEVKWI